MNRAENQTLSACSGDSGGALAEPNGYTVASYERCAADYARATKPGTTEVERQALGNFLRVARNQGWILEIGSGPGWDADWLDHAGLNVRRTDAADAFVAFQKARGAQAEVLDVVKDELGGPYAGVVALHVFQHIYRSELPHVMTKVSHAIADRGAFLFSLREGSGDLVEKGESSGNYYIAMWQRADLVAILEPLGFREVWSSSVEDSDGRWLTILATKDGANEKERLAAAQLP
jgi:hypothetical protein